MNNDSSSYLHPHRARVTCLNSIVVLFAHPSLENSRVHQAWLEAISSLQCVEIRDLYQLYPEFDVDVKEEQRIFEAHDIIVLQHPLYWYSTPALLKQYQDLEHGWAYGAGGAALRGKEVLSAVSMGGQQDAYERGGFHDITVDELLAPIRQTVRLCNMHYLPPFLEHGAFLMGPDDVVKICPSLPCCADRSTRWKAGHRSIPRSS